MTRWGEIHPSSIHLRTLHHSSQGLSIFPSFTLYINDIERRTNNLQAYFVKKIQRIKGLNEEEKKDIRISPINGHFSEILPLCALFYLHGVVAQLNKKSFKTDQFLRDFKRL